MESLTNVSYQLKKLDIIGVLGFQKVSVQNWGLLSFNIDHLLLDNKNHREILHISKIIIRTIVLQVINYLSTNLFFTFIKY